MLGWGVKIVNSSVLRLFGWEAGKGTKIVFNLISIYTNHITFNEIGACVVTCASASASLR